ncbi:carboxymuconolactone decarboxylase family protein [Actinoplanes sp. KI2]|uniref:carboxymuconolactone decarboxylase family protein n=1 Tax=Actinoplanes sp. KI2 TaxID=2983315 RepID=UPI0021D5C260|nr:carboxymuconolactone decarboxylase family protein [Actinoplanes sp. KI2]MCU7727364.1 carboxymuconolactone decarboxylase family protein [Actinoplanes sp. KI2]
MAYRFFAPPPARSAAGPVAEVYRQLRADFIGPAPTFQALSVAPGLLTATWTLMREALLAGPADRVEREVVAAAVSRANRCRFCVDAHVTMLHALGEHELAERIAGGVPPASARHAALADWAEASRTPRAARWTGAHGPELTGTLLAFHFINRIVSALLAPDLLPGGMQRFPAVRSAGGRLYARTARSFVEPGDCSVDAAYAALREVALRGGDLLSEAARETVAGTVRWEDGRHPDRPADWAGDLVRDLPATERVGARIVLLAAFAPGAISVGDVGLWRLTHPGDADLVRLLGYGAIAATDHVARALRQGTRHA